MNQMNKDSNSINITGLTDEEVRQRVEEGFTNRTDISTDKTTKEIVVSNVFTYFNLIFLVITILLIMVGSFRNLTFLPIIIGNTVIGIVQEIRAKKTLEKMSLLNAPHADVIRNGSVKQISTDELVKDDVILLTAGKQICADAVVISGNIQVNESLLTGEADEVEKTEGSTLMSGSFVVSGECYARLEKVGNESYISKLSLEAKSMGGKEQSEMAYIVLAEPFCEWRVYHKERYIDSCSDYRNDTGGLVSADHSGACIKHYEACKEKGFAS